MLHHIRSSLGREWCLMSTYEEFMVILTVAILIVTILNHRK
nr:MAG TPA: Putative Holin-like Toxin (Hol-Tox) [Caudoviricetes sp.]